MPMDADETAETAAQGTVLSLVEAAALGLRPATVTHDILHGQLAAIRVPPGQPPLPVLFASYREAQDYAAALSAQDRADDPAPPLPRPQDNVWGDGH